MPANDRASENAAAILAFRRERSKLLPRDIFAEPAWDLLLDLFVADAAGKRITAREVGAKSAVQPSVMSRWVRYLLQVGLVIGTSSSGLDDELTLSAKGFAAIEQMMQRADAITQEERPV